MKLALVKIGTLPGERVLIDREPVVGEEVRFKRSEKWENGRVWKIGDDGRVFIERW